MFNLDTDRVPVTAPQLTKAITDSLRRRIKLPPSPPPVVVAGNLPALTSLAVNVSDGQIDPNQPLPNSKTPQNVVPGPSAASFTIAGHPITIKGIAVQFDLSARNVAFGYARTNEPQLIATLLEATDGHLLVQMDHEHLEEAILAVSRKIAATSGVSIQSVSVTLTSISPTTVDVLLNIAAKKFVSAIVRISGRLSIDDKMVATAGNLKADADGVVGNIAVNFIRPQLQQLNGRPLPLLAFSLGNVKLRGIRVQTSDGLRIEAEFGSP